LFKEIMMPDEAKQGNTTQNKNAQTQKEAGEQAKPVDPKASASCRPLKYGRKRGESIRFVRRDGEGRSDDGE
jgi:hypothetical protein